MSYQNLQEVLVSAQRTETGNSGAIDLFDSGGGPGPGVRFLLSVTAADAGTLDVDINAVLPSGALVKLGSFAQVTTSVTSESIFVQGCPNRIRVDWTQAAGDHTFSVFAQVQP